MASFELGIVDAKLLPPPELLMSALDVLMMVPPSVELTADEEFDVTALPKWSCELVGVDGWEASRGNALASNSDPEPAVPVLLAAAASGGNMVPPGPALVVGVPECA